MASESLKAIQREFFSSPFFAVVGASKDPQRWGTKVLKWYQHRNYKVTPIHPKEPELEGIPTVTSIAELGWPQETSISVITSPKLTLSLLQQAKQLSVPALWLQPGTVDEAVIEYIENEGLGDRVIYGGPCILVDGDDVVSFQI